MSAIEARPSQSKPDRGIVRSRLEGLAPDGHAVELINTIRRRPADRSNEEVQKPDRHGTGGGRRRREAAATLRLGATGS